MKKTKVFYQNIVFALILVSVVMFSGIAQADAASLDGFVGVPWGASKQQVASAMAKRDFKQVAEGTDYVVYRGTFADIEADLTFAFGKNGLNTGEADLLGCRDQDIVFAMTSYPGIKRLLVAKYGQPNGFNDSPNPNMGGNAILSSWSMRTAGTPPAPASIRLWGGPVRRLQTYADNTTPELFRNGVLITYSANIVIDPY